MTAVFSAREIAEEAVEKERKRREFYATVCEQSEDEEMKALFRFLKEEEDRHVATFERIRDGLPKEEQSDEYYEDMRAYMDSLVDERLYSDVDSEEFVKKAVTTKDAVTLAIGFEKDAILYFREFIPYLAEADRKLVEDLIEQEKGHIRKLGELKRKIA